MHPSEVWDTHRVLSHAVGPLRPIAVKAAMPSPDPCTVTDAEPVNAVLYTVTELIVMMSIEYIAVVLPTCSPAVTMMVCDLRRPRPARHRSEVSDSHCVTSHAVFIILTFSVNPETPKLDPYTVTDGESFCAWFSCENLDIVALSFIVVHSRFDLDALKVESFILHPRHLIIFS